MINFVDGTNQGPETDEGKGRVVGSDCDAAAVIRVPLVFSCFHLLHEPEGKVSALYPFTYSFGWFVRPALLPFIQETCSTNILPSH